MPGEWIELPKKGVQKKLIISGHGVPVGSNPDGPVCVHYTGRLGSADGEIFDSSVGGEPFTFRIGGGEVIAGCDEGVASMCVGERAEFLIEPHKAYGSEGSEPEVPPNATLHFDIELIRNTALPRVLLGHDSEEPFTMGEGVVDAGVTAGLFEDAEETITTEADHSRDGDGGGGGMFDDATDDGTDGMFADADGSSIADQERVRTAGSGAVERRRRDEPDNIFSQLAGGGDGDELGEQRNGVVRFNIGADLQDSAAGADPIPDVQDADSFPTIGKTDVVATPGWPRQPPPLSSALKTSSESRSAQPPAARAPTLAATASSCLGATASEPSWLGEGGVDGSPFPERSEDDILREAAELSGKPAPSDVLVVDTAGFLRSSPLETLGREIFTIPEVISEIRDRAVRERMAGVLPYELKFREPTPRSMGIVAEFARETGDFHGLSAVDLKVLALTHTLTVERNGDGGINTKPVISIRDAPKSSSRHGWFVPGVDAAEGGGTSANTTTDALPSDEPKPDPADPVKLAADAAASWGGNWDAEKSEDDRGWITPGNREAVVKTLGRKENHVKAVVRVGCVTADFSMQNVLLQMGMNVVSVDGLLIRRVKTFSLKCESCFRVTHEVHRKFCKACGHPTLYKITVSTNSEGKIEYRMPKRIRTTNRGARFTTAPAQMGRVNNLLVREDQREFTRPQRREKDFDAFTADHITGESPFKHTDQSINAKKGGKVGPMMSNRLVIGGGRNPNAVRKKTGNKKKK
eukprot:m.419947 g.419947  ORF g.419947 m.419947 type:complete len:751 (-) comp31947_c0_seq1:114-2366(-)